MGLLLLRLLVYMSCSLSGYGPWDNLQNAHLRPHHHGHYTRHLHYSATPLRLPEYPISLCQRSTALHMRHRPSPITVRLQHLPFMYYIMTYIYICICNIGDGRVSLFSVFEESYFILHVNV
ncbi:hypothetical protein O6H91_07G088400 [Diphasiastrum complanatum]|uniref:Uncharacterized protein n=1 Tax=Diphasiastrum complanatum TaxID=34168 RepID=A0ACC2D7B3_DIPCM|nr:hypothetical protein O6H91_07G088400 [Diphasiastrum complanatum]